MKGVNALLTATYNANALFKKTVSYDTFKEFSIFTIFPSTALYCYCFFGLGILEWRKVKDDQIMSLNNETSKNNGKNIKNTKTKNT